MYVSVSSLCLLSPSLTSSCSVCVCFAAVDALISSPSPNPLRGKSPWKEASTKLCTLSKETRKGTKGAPNHLLRGQKKEEEEEEGGRGNNTNDTNNRV